MDNEKEYTIAEEYSLPSGGRIYNREFDPRIKLRSMTVQDEVKRTNGMTAKYYETLCEIIDSCLLTKLPYKTYDLCMGDFEYLLQKLRVVSQGSDYKMVVGCPHCDRVYEETINLDDLKIKEFDLDEYQSLLTFTLPVTGKAIQLNVETPRLRDEIRLAVEKDKKNRKDGYDNSLVITMDYLIASVDGEPLNPATARAFIEKLPAKDGNYIMKKAEKARTYIGLDTSIDVKCKHCGGDIKTFFRFGPEFFGPSI